MQASASEIASWTGGAVMAGDGATRVTGFSTDTRTLQTGQAYVALDGPHFRGAEYAPLAVVSGAPVVVVPEGSWGIEADGAAVVAVADARAALRALGAAAREAHTGPVVGITGSCGKTSTKDTLAALLGDSIRAVSSPKSYNNDIGVPLTLLMAEPETEALVLEIGSNHPGEIAALCEVARPTCGVVTNIFRAHLEGFGSLDGVAEEKGALVEAVDPGGFVVLNADCPRTVALAERAAAEVVWVGLDEDADVFATDLHSSPAGTTFRLDGSQEVTLPLQGTHSVVNLLMALAVAERLGVERGDALDRVRELEPSQGRLESKRFGALQVVDDTYNSNPASAEAAVRVLAGMAGPGAKVLVLGDMLELGEQAEDLHARVGRAAGAARIDRVIAVGSFADDVVAGAVEAGMAAEDCTAYGTVAELGDELPGLLQSGDSVLLKGSRGIGLERMVDLLAEAFGEASA